MKNRDNQSYTVSKTVSAKPNGSFGKAPAVRAPREKSSMGSREQMPWTVFNRYGQRKYLTSSEVDSFVKSAKGTSIEVQSFCWMLAFSGCRISEALSLTRDSIDFEAEHVIIRCLKKRGKRVFRAIPLPPEYLKLLRRWLGQVKNGTSPLWPWSRMTGYRRICEVMQSAGIRGTYATPKGLRHAFGIRAIQASVPLTLVQRWLGHADIKTTAIYTGAMGPEEREIAARMWKTKSMWGRSSSGPSSTPRSHEPDPINAPFDYHEFGEYTRDTSAKSENFQVSTETTKIAPVPTSLGELVNLSYSRRSVSGPLWAFAAAGCIARTTGIAGVCFTAFGLMGFSG